MESLLPAYIESLRPILYIEDTDFHAVDAQIKSVADGAKIHEYSSAYGEVNFQKGNPTSESSASLFDFLNLYKDAGFNNKIFLVLKDIHHELAGQERHKIIAQLRHIAEKTLYAKEYHTVIFIISGTREIPNELEHLITLLPGTRPEQTEIEETLLKKFACEHDFEINADDLGSLALELKGLSRFQIRQILNLAYCKGGYISFAKDKKLIFDEKRQIVEKSGMLEFLELSEKPDDVGGLNALKAWLERKAEIFNELSKALKAGVDRPKGVLILGVPGCGKSLTAKTTAQLFGVPLLRLDIGRVLGKYVGESENNMRAALKLAEAISPCILWIDEVEKAFAGGGGSGHEVTARLIGQFLTWMQEKKNTVFVVATANDVASLPPEFLRKGRFDEIFSVDLPEEEERLDILKIHLTRRKQSFRELDLYVLLDLTKEFSGADIEYAVATAVESAFMDGRNNVSNDDLSQAVKSTRPLARSLKEKIERQRKTLKEYDVRPAAEKDLQIPKRNKGENSETQVGGSATATIVKGTLFGVAVASAVVSNLLEVQASHGQDTIKVKMPLGPTLRGILYK